MFRRTTKRSAATAHWISGAALLGLLVTACNPSPHLDPPGGPGGSGPTTTTSATDGGGGAGADGGGTTSSNTGGGGGSAPVDCKSNADCSYPENLCDVVAGKCVECLVTADCSEKPGTVCSQASCSCPVAAEEFCPADGYGPARCADLMTATKDCGECGYECFGACNGGACADAWEPLAKVGAPSPRVYHVAVWTGTVMVVWGGWNGSSVLGDGAMYNPATREWTPMNNANAPSPRERATVVWTGTEMIVWGGRGSGGVPLADGGRFNPANNTWLAVGAGGPSPRYEHTAVWSGNPTRMIVWGGYDGADELETGGYYVPGDAWSELTNAGMSPPPNPPPTQRRLHTAVYDDAKSRMIVFGGLGLDPNSGMITSLSSVGVYDLVPMADNWFDIQAGSPPAPRYEHAAVWAGNHMIVWGGFNNALGLLGDGARFDAQGNNEWTSMSGEAPSPRRRHSAVYFPAPINRMVVWGGLGASNEVLGDGGVFNVAEATWAVGGVPKSPAPSVDHTAVAAGSSMIVFGGITSDGSITNAGAILDMSKVP